MRYLILGKDGMLGHDLLHVFGDTDFIGYGKRELDVTNREAVFKAMVTVQPDVVINATGYTDVDLCEKEEELANTINGNAVSNLAQACREFDATLVHFSTDYVFGGTKKTGYNEEDATSPINAYGRSKALGESLLTDEMESLDETKPKEGKYFIIRTSWLYGHYGRNFAETIIENAKKKLLKIVNDQNGKPTFTMDLARQVKWLLQSREYPSGIYHVTNEGVTSWYEFAREILRLARVSANVVPCSTAEVPRPAARPKFSALNNNKLPPLRHWKDALAEYLTTKP
jgi:dTDP-4-dehydrorhamnose reductase